jgi:hypothetical protein
VTQRLRVPNEPGVCALSPLSRRRRYEVRAHWAPITGLWLPNLVLYEWGAIQGRGLLGEPGARITHMYLEFENSGDPDTPAVAPSLGRGADQGIEYYNSLSVSADRDYLRVPLVAGTLASSDETLYPKGNLPTFFAQTSGVEGVWGKPFSDAENSRIFGAALVALVDEDDPTQDLVYSRIYLDAANQQVKLPTSQVGVEWEMRFK